MYLWTVVDPAHYFSMYGKNVNIKNVRPVRQRIYVDILL